MTQQKCPKCRSTSQEVILRDTEIIQGVTYEKLYCTDCSKVWEDVFLSDDDPMPFGKHKGKKMKEVPASYLDWLSDQWKVDTLVRRYIKKNWKAIEAELEGR